jgi:hypothetical protein
LHGDRLLCMMGTEQQFVSHMFAIALPTALTISIPCTPPLCAAA